MGRVRKKYPREFKLEAVRLMQKGESNTSELARRLNVSEADLRAWRKQYEEKKEESFPGQGRSSGSAAEIARLRRELEQVKEERDILKKAMAFFARESR
jgi:transposase-like protein